jgi:hypothetical protein
MIIPPVSHIQRTPVKRISKYRYRGRAVSYAYHVKGGGIHDRGWIDLAGFGSSRVAASFPKSVRVVLRLVLRNHSVRQKISLQAKVEKEIHAVLGLAVRQAQVEGPTGTQKSGKKVENTFCFLHSL